MVFHVLIYLQEWNYLSSSMSKWVTAGEFADRRAIMLLPLAQPFWPVAVSFSVSNERQHSKSNGERERKCTSRVDDGLQQEEEEEDASQGWKARWNGERWKHFLHHQSKCTFSSQQFSCGNTLHSTLNPLSNSEGRNIFPFLCSHNISLRSLHGPFAFALHLLFIILQLHSLPSPLCFSARCICLLRQVFSIPFKCSDSHTVSVKSSPATGLLLSWCNLALSPRVFFPRPK